MIAQDTTYDDVQAPIPSTQWQKEVSIWFSTALAKEQAWAVEWATAIQNIPASSSNSSNQFPPNPPTNPQLAAQCRNQLVRDSGSHLSCSVWGLVIVLTVGGLIIILGLAVDFLGAWFRKARRRNEWRAEQWNEDDGLQLIRGGFQDLGLWGDGTEPMTPLSVLWERRRGAGGGEDEVEKGVQVGKNGYAAVSVGSVAES
jgi:hypothetical protein